MKILIANDDGINSSNLKLLVEWAKSLGDVTVVAPKNQQSAKSHAIDIHDPFEVKQVDVFEGVESYYVDSTPADCVRFGIKGLKRKYDYVFSGINHGYNLGNDILYSGTVAIAFEASLEGHKTIAFSAGYHNTTLTQNDLQGVWDFIINNNLFDYSPLYNVNFPDVSKGIRITRQGADYYKDEFIKVADDMYSQQGYSAYVHTGNLDLDTDCVAEGYTSISPLTTERTDISAYEKIKCLNK